MKIVVGIDLLAPPARVWEIVEPIERHVDWMADAVAITFRSGRTRGTGTSFDCVTKVGPITLVDAMVVTEWEPGHVMGIEHRGLVTGTGRFTLEAVGTGTRFTWAEELRFPWWMGGAVGAWSARPVLRAIWRRNLRGLKTLVEER